MPTALITGASRGFGAALTASLARDGWHVVVDARGSDALETSVRDLDGAPGRVTALAGDVTDPHHRSALARQVNGGLDLLVNNASCLGPSPLPALAEYSISALRSVFETNVVAPLALTQLVLRPLRQSVGIVVNVSSDAAVEAYEGWGGYGASKAALDRWSAVLAAEEPRVNVYSFDPGDMQTAMHQEAFPGEDISDRPAPETIVPALRRLISERPRSGRYRAADLNAAAVVA
jgi:NAD(P)-dependent dehydrogenase (short-subunit alcohol dehydrogenase family)